MLHLWAFSVSFCNKGNTHQLCKLKLTPTKRLFAHVKVLLDYLLVPFFSVDTRTFCYLAYYQRLIMALFYLYPAIISWNNLEHRLPFFTLRNGRRYNVNCIVHTIQFPAKIQWQEYNRPKIMIKTSFAYKWPAGAFLSSGLQSFDIRLASAFNDMIYKDRSNSSI